MAKLDASRRCNLQAHHTTAGYSKHRRSQSAFGESDATRSTSLMLAIEAIGPLRKERHRDQIPEMLALCQS